MADPSETTQVSRESARSRQAELLDAVRALAAQVSSLQDDVHALRTETRALPSARPTGTAGTRDARRRARGPGLGALRRLAARPGARRPLAPARDPLPRRRRGALRRRRARRARDRRRHGRGLAPRRARRMASARARSESGTRSSTAPRAPTLRPCRTTVVVRLERGRHHARRPSAERPPARLPPPE